MDAADDERTFRVNFTSEGADKLRESVNEKLREFMGDYTDNTLVEYVVVLLRNGRRKDEARKELNVFLGADCVSFVSWLWDHLSSNLHLYAQSKGPFSDQVAKTKPTSITLSGKHNIQLEHVNGSMHIDSEHDRDRPNNVSRNRRNREWKGLVQEEAQPFCLRSVVPENAQSEEKIYHRSVGRSYSPRPQVHRKRNRQDELQLAKRERNSHPVIDAPRRLLQFAVRDAVRTVQQMSSRTELPIKRLRSVVSTPTADSEFEERPLTRSVPRVSDGVTMTWKTAAEAPEDVFRVRCQGNVFHRLRHGIDNAETDNQSSDLREHVLEGESEDLDQLPVSNHLKFHRNGNYIEEFAGDMIMLNSDNEMACDSASDSDGYNDVSILNHRGLNVSRSASVNKEKDDLMVQYSAAPDADEVARETRLMDEDPSATTPASVSRKIVNISVNVNTCKPANYANSRSGKEVGNHITWKKIDVGAGKPNVQLLKENNTAISEKENDVARADFQKEVQKTASAPGSGTVGRPDDVDSRILFVSNVHFAATKDTLSRHFNKFGQVLKVIIVTDAATGQPKGSAYVEFIRKESAEHALSLNGTSFMSRILKVVRRSSAQHHEAAPIARRPRNARASLYPPMVGVPFPRGVAPGAFRARLPTKHGARSLQWKRGDPNTQTTEGLKSLHNTSVTPVKNTPTPTSRNLKYIRPALKAEGISGS